MNEDGLPDPVCNPGAANPAVTQDTIASTICLAGYTATIRPLSSYTNALKIDQMKAYGFEGDPANYEEDHVIALELGGDPRDPRNLWPQPRTPAGAADLKDRVENWAHQETCALRIPLRDAQRQIAVDWRAFYQVMIAATAIKAPASTAAQASPAISPASSAVTVQVPAPKIVPTAAPGAATPPVAPAALTFAVTITTSVWGTVAATTSLGATCNATAKYASGNYSTAQGITATTVADASGNVSWTYTKTATTTKGTGTYTVTCGLSGQTRSATSTFLVS